MDPSVRLLYIGQAGDSLADIPRNSGDIDEVYSVSAGKLRRYHGEGWRQLLDIETMSLNVRDMFRVVKGYLQAYRLLKRLQPDVVFVKGGFVGVPVGLAAAKLHIPYITHDSDAIPGLANRLIARWATLHAVALPKEVYAYPADKTLTVGVPVHANYEAVTPEAQAAYAAEIGLGAYQKIILVTGGGLGAQRLNDAVILSAPKLLEAFPDLAIVHSVGRNNETAANEHYRNILSEEQQSRVVVMGYIEDMQRYSGAATIVVTRAGATALAEFAIQQKTCIVVPNPYLTGGHQTKNADYLASQGAIEVVLEGALAYDLPPTITKLLKDSSRCRDLAKTLGKFAIPDAARQLAMVLLEQAKS